jgi:hypothetical protein
MTPAHGLRTSALERTSVVPTRAALAMLGLAALTLSAAPASAQNPQPNRIRIEYVEPKNPDFQLILDELKKRKALEALQEIFSPVRLPSELTIKTVECGMSNAWYQRPTLTICYEYLADMRKTTPKETSAAGITPDDALLGQFFYVVAHEMGHALFDALNVPLFGGPETAADQFAAYMMLTLGKQDARRLIGGAAYTYKDYVDKDKVIVPKTAFADIHGAPMQRLYNLLCIAYGADREMFADVVEAGYLPKDRARGCRVEYGEVNYAFQQTIRPSLDPELAKAVMAKSWLPPVTTRPDQPPPVPEQANSK